MKTLSSQADAARLASWSKERFLLEITFWRDKFGASPVSTVVRMSDQYRTDFGLEWLPLVKTWGGLGDALDLLTTGGSLATFDVTLFNTMRIDTPTFSVARFTDLVRMGLNGGANTWDVQFADVKLYVIFEGAASVADAVIPFRMQAEEVVNWTPTTCELRMSGVELALENAEDLYRPNSQDFPFADPDALAQPVPLVMNYVTDVPGLGIQAGIMHRLANDITETEPGDGGGLFLSDPALIARMPDSGTVQVDEEPFTYVNRNLDLVALGLANPALGQGPARPGTKKPHNKGAPVFQVLTEYVYAFATNPGAHRNGGVVRVKSDGAVVDPTTYTVTVQDTGRKAGRSFLTVAFTVLPVIKRQVKLVVEKTGTVIKQGTATKGGAAAKTGAATKSGTVSTGAEQVRQDVPLSVMPITLVLPFTLDPTERGPYQTAAALTLPDLPADGAIVTRVIWEIAFDGVSDTRSDWQATISLPGIGDLVLYRSVVTPPSFSGVRINNPNRSPLCTVQGTTHGATIAVGLKSWLGIPGSIGGGFNTELRITSLKATIHRTMPLSDTIAVNDAIGVQDTITVEDQIAVIDQIGINVSGNSSADTVLGEITADVNGLLDDGSGTITAFTADTAVPNLPLELPADFAYLFMREMYGEKTAANFNAARWQATRFKQFTAGLRWAGLYTGMGWRDFRAAAGLQGRADLFQESGQWVYAYRETTSAVITFDGRNTIGQPVLGQSPRTEIVTVLQGQYDWNPAAKAWRGSLERRSTRYADRMGTRRRINRDEAVRDLPLPWVRDPAVADALTTYWLGQLETPRMTVTLRAAWEALILDKTDTIAMDAAAFPLMAAFGAIGFMLRRKTYRLAERLLELEAIAVDQLPSQLQKAAAYVLLRTTTKPVPAQFRLDLVKNLDRAAPYRLVTLAELTEAAQYFLGIPQTPTQPAAYVLAPTLTRELAAAYSIVTLYDSGLLYDDPTVFYDGQNITQHLYDAGLLYDSGLLYDT